MFYRFLVVSEDSDLFNVMSIDNLDLKFTRQVRTAREKGEAAYSLETANQFSSGERARSLIGSVVLTSISFKSPDGTAYSHTVPSSHPSIT